MIISVFLVLAIYLLIVAGRFLPVADAACQTAHVPINSIPPIVPYVLILTGCTLLIYIVFKLTLPEKAH